MFYDDEKDISNELYRTMEKQLVNNQLENKYAFNKIAKSIDYLHLATKLFDKAGMHQEANEITNVIKDVYKKLNK